MKQHNVTAAQMGRGKFVFLYDIIRNGMRLLLCALACFGFDLFWMFIIVENCDGVLPNSCLVAVTAIKSMPNALSNTLSNCFFFKKKHWPFYSSK